MNLLCNNYLPKNQVNQYIFLITIIVLGSTFSSLRFSAFGIFELFIIVLIFLLFLRRQINFMPGGVHSYWILVNLVICLGTLYNIFLGINDHAINRFFFDFLAYMFMFVWVLALENIFNRFSLEELNKLIRSIAFTIIPVIFILFIFSLFTNSLFGLPLYYYYRFAPLSHNPAFVGYLMYPMPWIAVYLSSTYSNLKGKSLCWLMAILAIFPILWTQNDIGRVTLLLTLFLGIVFGFNKPIKVRLKPLLLLLFSGILVAIYILKTSNIVNLFQEFLAEADGGYRLILWQNSLKAWLTSPLIGLGYGPHSGFSMYEGIESHSIYITLLTQGGLIGFFIMMYMYFKILKVSTIKASIFLIVVSILLPGISGTPIRKISTWFYLALVFHLSKRLKVVELNRSTDNEKST